ncbi:hypothetical protein [Synechocystis salina]|nr:hypothetical protein [Synechocystis salina]
MPAISHENLQKRQKKLHYWHEEIRELRLEAASENEIEDDIFGQI